MSYKSVRLLNDAIHKQMDELRKNIMGVEPSAWGGTTNKEETFEALDDLRKLLDELAAKADRPTIDEVTKQSPGDYVATMKPLVGLYHRQLMAFDKLAPCICEDLQASGVVLMIIGDGKTVVRTAVDENRPEIQLAVEIILQALEQGTQQTMTEGVAEAEKQLGIPQDGDAPPELEQPEPEEAS